MSRSIGVPRGKIGTRADQRHTDSGLETMGIDRSVVWMVLAIVGPMTMSGSASVNAGEIYKSVDQAGRVTYSAAPLADAVTAKTVPPPHQPTPEEVWAAEEQYQLIQTIGSELEKDRRQREAEQARQAAEESVQQNAGQLTIVFWPVPVFVGPVRPVSNHRSHHRLKQEPMGLSERPRLL